MYLVRRELLQKIYSDLQLVTTENGYNHTFNSGSIRVGILPTSTIKSYPTVMLEAGDEKMRIDESGSIPFRELDLFIITMVNTTDIDTIEEYIEDIKAFFTYVEGSSLPICDLTTIKYVTDFYVEYVSPIFDRVKNITMVGTKLKVSYADIVDNETLSRITGQNGEYLITQ